MFAKKIYFFDKTCVLRRKVSNVFRNKLARVKRKKEEEKMIKQAEEVLDTKKITANLTNVEYTGNCVKGHKKDVSCPLPPSYSPRFVEAHWYDWWEKEGFHETFKRKNTNSEIFSMVVPPPNVTGNLHLGHALTVALEDALCRWHRMLGHDVVWVPGCDHAGIATQVVVEKLLSATRNVSRHDLGREKFLKEIWKWKDEKEEEIYRQLRCLGASLDWTRTNFTMSPQFSRAVSEAFIRLQEKDLIYQKKSLVNWSFQLQSTISDIEIDYKPLAGPANIAVPGYDKTVKCGFIHTFSYPFPDNDKQPVEVSTTRIETMLGDTAIAVHPDDIRYKSVIGSFVQHPLLPERYLPVIADSHVDMNFGTDQRMLYYQYYIPGAVKITPAHDFHDFEIGTRHNLQFIDVFDDYGNVTNTGNSRFDNLPRFRAREEVVSALSEKGLYKSMEPHAMLLPICSRSGDIVEPRIKTQWFVKTKELSKAAIEAVKTGLIKIEPDSHLQSWYAWLSKNEDWCISRQLWWGHRIPAYEVSHPSLKDPIWITASNEQEAKMKAVALTDKSDGDLKVVQDEDVLDTWFSSSLFPFACFGWPNDSEDLKRFYPLSVMETGYDLLFFWVARMTMMALALTNEVPFKTVYLHSMVRDSLGQKMSKSLGNVIDPLQIINGCSIEEMEQRVLSSHLGAMEKKTVAATRKRFPNGIPECGTDALRFYLYQHKKMGKDICLDVNSVMQCRFFCNKIWNAFKFLLMNVEKRESDVLLDHSHLRPIDQWIRSRLSFTVAICNDAMSSLNIAVAATSLQKFFMFDFADVYLESCKTVFADHSDFNRLTRLSVQINLEFVMNSFFCLLSPFMPYISEELWQRLPNQTYPTTSVTIADYPTLSTHDFRDTDLENDIQTSMNVVHKIREVKQLFGVSAKQTPALAVVASDDCALKSLRRNEQLLKSLARTGDVDFLFDNGSCRAEDFPGSVAYAVPDNNYDIQIFLQLKNHVNAEGRCATLHLRAKTLRGQIESTQEKMTTQSGSLKKFQTKLTAHQNKLQEIEKMLLQMEKLK